MKKNIFILLLIVLIGGLFFVFNQPFHAEAQPTRFLSDSRVETWTFGVTSEGSAAYSETASRLITNVASFRANQGENEVYFIFPAPAETKTVQAGSVNFLSRSGTTPNTATLSLDVVNLDGTWQHTVTQSLDALVITSGDWVDFTLSDVPTDLVITPGQTLVAHLTFSEPGDLDIKCIFDIEVE